MCTGGRQAPGHLELEERRAQKPKLKFKLAQFFIDRGRKQTKRVKKKHKVHGKTRVREEDRLSAKRDCPSRAGHRVTVDSRAGTGNPHTPGKAVLQEEDPQARQGADANRDQDAQGDLHCLLIVHMELRISYQSPSLR